MKIYNQATPSETVFNEFCFLRAKFTEGGGEGGPKPLSVYTQIYYPFLSPKFLRKTAHNLGKNKWSRT